MTNQFPITVPPELFTEWLSEALLEHDAKSGTVAAIVADKAAQWSADQELEACCEWVRSMFSGHPTWADELRPARHPKPVSLKKQALNDLDTIQTHDAFGDQIIDLSTIRRAIEALPNE